MYRYVCNGEVLFESDYLLKGTFRLEKGGTKFYRVETTTVKEEDGFRYIEVGCTESSESYEV